MARNSKQVLLQLKGDSTDAKRALQDVRSDMRRMSREETEIKVNIQTARVGRQIEQVKRQLEALSRKEATPRVEVQTARAREQLQLLELRLDRLRLKRVNIDVDVQRGSLERIAGGLGAVDRGIGSVTRGISDMFRAFPILGRLIGAVLTNAVRAASALGEAIGGVVGNVLGFTKLGPAIGSVVGGVASVALNFAGLAAVAGGLIIALNAVLGAIAALGAALIALVASLAAAVAGLGALGVAFLAALGPAILVVIGLFQRFAAIIEARKAQEQELTQATEAQKQAEQRRIAALDQSKVAHTRLAETVIEARRAMAKAAEDQEDAERSLESSRLGVKEARLSLREARQELREFLRGAGAVGPTLNALTKKFSDVDFDPSQAGRALGAAGGRAGGDKGLELQRRILALQRAQLNVKDAVDRVSDSERELGEARRRNNEFTERGVRAYKPYIQALNQVRVADRRLRQAQEQTTAAQRKHEQALKELSGTERGTLDRVNRLVDGFKRLAKAFTDPIFRSLNGVFDDLSGRGGLLEDALKRIGEAMAGAVRQLGVFLGERQTRQAFKEMAAGAADLVTQLGGRAFTSFLRIMREVASAALPAVRRGATRVADALEVVAGKPGRIREVVSTLIDHFKTWAGLAWQVLRAVVGIFRGAAGPGRSLAGSLTTIVRKFADWANSDEGQRKISRFFQRMINRAKEIVRQIIRIAIWLRENLPGAAADAKTAFEGLWAVLKGIAATVKVIQDGSEAIGKVVFGSSGEGRESRTDLTKPVQRLKDKDLPRESRIDLGLSLLELRISTKLRKEIEEILRRLGFKGKFPKFHGGGLVGHALSALVPSVGGNEQLGILKRGEFVIRDSIVAQLGAQSLEALNAGRMPTTAVAGGSQTSIGRQHVGDQHFTFHVRAAADPKAAAKILERELRLAR